MILMLGILYISLFLTNIIFFLKYKIIIEHDNGGGGDDGDNGGGGDDNDDGGGDGDDGEKNENCNYHNDNNLDFEQKYIA